MKQSSNLKTVLSFLQYDEGLHGYMDSGSAAAAMYDPHAGHRPPGLQGLPPHHSPHMSHAAAAAAANAVGMHGYHSGHGSAPSHVSPVANHVMGSIPEVHKRDKDAIYGYVHTWLLDNSLSTERASATIITLHVEETAVERRIMQIHVFAVVAMTEQQQQQHNTQLQQCNWYLLVHLLAHSADRVAGRLKNYHYYYYY